MTSTRTQVLATLAAVACLAGVLLPSTSALAGRLKAKVYLTQSPIPRKLTERKLIGFARRNQTFKLRESSAAPLTKRKWNANMVVAFNQAPGDLEFDTLFYDVHDGPRRFVEDLSTFISNRKQRTFVRKLSLPRSRFKPNRHMELAVVVNHQEVARLKFGVIGEEKRRTGEVTFRDDETK